MKHTVVYVDGVDVVARVHGTWHLALSVFAKRKVAKC